MFQFLHLPPHAYLVPHAVPDHSVGRVSPFGYLRICARLAAPRSFSQPTTSFLGLGA